MIERVCSHQVLNPLYIDDVCAEDYLSTMAVWGAQTCLPLEGTGSREQLTSPRPAGVQRRASRMMLSQNLLQICIYLYCTCEYYLQY
jgi:hypothetical protein